MASLVFTTTKTFTNTRKSQTLLTPKQRPQDQQVCASSYASQQLQQTANTVLQTARQTQDSNSNMLQMALKTEGSSSKMLRAARKREGSSSKMFRIA